MTIFHCEADCDMLKLVIMYVIWRMAVCIISFIRHFNLRADNVDFFFFFLIHDVYQAVMLI